MTLNHPLTSSSKKLLKDVWSQSSQARHGSLAASRLFAEATLSRACRA